MRVIGLDVHRSFAEVAILENGTIQHAGRFKLEHRRVTAFGKTLKRVRRVVVANPLHVRSIAWAKVKTDEIDAAVLAKLHASGFLPEVWIPNEETEARRNADQPDLSSLAPSGVEASACKNFFVAYLACAVPSCRTGLAIGRSEGSKNGSIASRIALGFSLCNSTRAKVEFSEPTKDANENQFAVAAVENANCRRLSTRKSTSADAADISAVGSRRTKRLHARSHRNLSSRNR